MGNLFFLMLYSLTLQKVHRFLALSVIHKHYPMEGHSEKTTKVLYLYCEERHSKTVRQLIEISTIWMSIKGTLSAGWSSMIIWLTAEDFYLWYIWWSIMGSVCYWAVRGAEFFEEIWSFAYITYVKWMETYCRIVSRDRRNRRTHIRVVLSNVNNIITR